MKTTIISRPSIQAVLLLLVALGAGAGSPRATDPVYIEDTGSSGPVGRHRVSGMDDDGTTYQGDLVITELSSALYRLVWSIDDGYSFVGKATLVGDTLSGAWALEDLDCHIVLYEIVGKGELEGLWVSTADDAEARGSERAVRDQSSSSSGSLYGSYSVAGSDPSGKAYEGRLESSPLPSSQNGYLFRWQRNGVFEGVGILEEDWIRVVAASEGEGEWCGGTVFKVEEDERLSGRWWMSDPEAFGEPNEESAVLSQAEAP